MQFLPLGAGGTHAEVSAPAADELEGPGWQPPTKPRGRLFGSSNFTADALASEAHRLAAMAVAVLRDHWHLPAPSAPSAEKGQRRRGPPLNELDLPGPVVVRGFEAGVH